VYPACRAKQDISQVVLAPLNVLSAWQVNFEVSKNQMRKSVAPALPDFIKITQERLHVFHVYQESFKKKQVKLHAKTVTLATIPVIQNIQNVKYVKLDITQRKRRGYLDARLAQQGKLGCSLKVDANFVQLVLQGMKTARS